MKKLLTCAWILAAAICNAEDAVLYWMVDDPIVYEFDEAGTACYLEEVSSKPDGYHIEAARVKMLDDGSYLQMLNNDQTLGPTHIDVVDYGDGKAAGPAMALIDAELLTAEHSFIVELGLWTGDEWLTIAVSKAENGEALREFSSTSVIGDPGHLHWTIDAAYVPEPSSFLLLLIGAGLLNLRRKV